MTCVSFRQSQNAKSNKMVLYFTSNVVEPPAIIYMGKDKFENEDLIKHAWDCDIWFHADKLSSAHIYLRLQPCTVRAEPVAASSSPAGSSASPATARKGKSFYTPPANAAAAAVDDHVYCTTWEDIPEVLLADLAQLTKANSIEGNKKDNVAIIYTPASNLKKTGDMATGAVSFHSGKTVKRTHVPTRINDIINRLNKTKEERQPDLFQEKLDYEKAQRAIAKEADRKRRAEEERMKREWKEHKAASNYDTLFNEEEMTTNRGAPTEEDDDFFM
ncbi:hypothetical protein BC828DRAFT_390809 [Blastocladiella britannica]|nr:hypothetical protein BC828DRAFT_390809 [Blastocladiella britannica]